MEVINIENGRPIFSWCQDAEEVALDQMKIIATKLPFVKHISLMPDCHLGQNTCIGSVIACDNVVVPDFCGQDAGCGMAAIKTSLCRTDIQDEGLRRKILHSFSRSVPTGFSHNSEKRMEELKSNYTDEIDSIISESNVLSHEKHNPIGNLKENIASSVATLGGG